MLDFVDADGGGSGTMDLERRYLYGNAVDQILAQENIDESTGSADRVYWHLVDRLGTVRDLAKNDGTLGEHYEYDSFGNVVSGDTSVTRYLFTSREFDEDTGLQYNRARWYDAAVGRWASEDPIGFAARDTSLSRYASNNVINSTDPSGLAAPKPWDPWDDPPRGIPAWLRWLAGDPTDSAVQAVKAADEMLVEAGEAVGQDLEVMGLRPLAQIAKPMIQDPTGFKEWNDEMEAMNEAGFTPAAVPPIPLFGSLANPAVKTSRLYRSAQRPWWHPETVFGPEPGMQTHSRIAPRTVYRHPRVTPFKNGELFETVFETSQGKVGLLAETVVDGKTLRLTDVVVEPVKTGKLNVGLKEVLAARKQLEAQARAAGFEKLIITGERLTGANVGKKVELIIDL